MQKVMRLSIAGLAVAVIFGSLSAPSGAQQPPPPRPSAQQCESVLPSRTVDPIVAKYRERLQTARDSMMREERTLVSLLAAENTTRAAADTQATKVGEARNALTRVRLDMLWELRSVVPAANREQAFRCAGRLLFRQR